MGKPDDGPLNRAAFERVVEELADRVYSIALRVTGSREDAEDALQETFLSAYQHWDEFRGEAAPSTWIYRIAVNAALQRVRQRRPYTPLDDLGYESDNIPDWSSDTPAGVVHAELLEKLEEAIARLPDEYRVAVVLRDVEGFSTAEAAETLSISEAALKSRVHRGRVLLRQYLQAYIYGET